MRIRTDLIGFALVLVLAGNLSLAQDFGVSAQAEGSVNGLVGAVIYDEGDSLAVTYTVNATNLTHEAELFYAEAWLDNWEYDRVDHATLPILVPAQSADYEVSLDTLNEYSADGWEYYSELWVTDPTGIEHFYFYDFWM